MTWLTVFVSEISKHLCAQYFFATLLKRLRLIKRSLFLVLSKISSQNVCSLIPRKEYCISLPVISQPIQHQRHCYTVLGLLGAGKLLLDHTSPGFWPSKVLCMCSAICVRVIPQASAGPSVCIVLHMHWSLQECGLTVFYVLPYPVMSYIVTGLHVTPSFSSWSKQLEAGRFMMAREHSLFSWSHFGLFHSFLFNLVLF